MLTFISLWNMRNRTLISLVLLSLLTACGKSGGGGSGEPPAEGGPVDVPVPADIVDPDGIFSDLGVTSLAELETKVKDEGLLDIIGQITAENADIQVEQVVRLLNQNNRKLEYDKVLQKDVPVAVVEKLKHLRMSPVSVEKMVELPSFSFVPKDDVTPQALEIYNQLRLKELNNKLNLRGQNSITLEEFIGLQTAFSQVEMVNRFGRMDKQLQNVIVPDSPKVTAQKSSAPQKTLAKAQLQGINPQLSPGFSYFNPVNEDQELTPDSDLPFVNSTCSILANFDGYPRSISKQDAVVNDGFSTEENGNALMHFPKSGIAVIKFMQDMPLKVLNPEGEVLIDQAVSAGQFVYLPVQRSDICDAYTFIGVSNAYDITMLALVSPERMSTHTFIGNQEYLTGDTEAELINHNSFFNPVSYSFTSFDSSLREFEFLFSRDADSSSRAQFDILVYSPSGKVYSSVNNTVATSYQELAGLTAETITREPGIWRVDLLPASSISVKNQQLQELFAVSMEEEQERGYLNLVTLVTTDNETKHKEFVLGTLKTVSFNTEGEDGTHNPGEVNVTLNTVMAPPLEIPTLLDKLLDEDTGKLSDEVALWQCWEKSEKTGFELEPGNECEAFSGPYGRLESLFEDIHTYSNYEKIGDEVVRLQSQCPREWEEQANSQGYCDKGIGDPYDYLPEDYAPQDRKVRYVLNYHAKTMNSRYAGESFLYTLSRHYDLYANWVSRAVQVSTSTFPQKHINYKTREYLTCNPNVPCDPYSATRFAYHNAVILEPNKPIFGAPVERIAESTAPITFDYTASDEDEYNADAALFAVLEFAAVQTLNLFNGNFIGMVCDSVNLVDSLHQIELDAEDDPLGSARASINRYSSSDPFYGLHNTRSLEFYMSGLPEKNTKIDTHGQRIKYAQVACGLGSLLNTGTNFAANADALLNLDYGKLSSLEEMTAAVQAMAILEQSESMADNAELIAEHIRSGNFDAAKSLLKIDTNVNSLITDQDMYSSTDQLLETYISGGSAANGNNVVKSSVQYLVGGEKKTRANLSFERVSSIPARKIKVTLNTVKIISNRESDNNSDDAEVILEPFVGEVSDRYYERYPHEPHGLMSGWSTSMGIANLEHNNVKDGDLLSPETVIFDDTSTRNTAAIYIELAILEDDGNSIEDDDMIGVFSQTLKLEELFNEGQFTWVHQGGNDYQLVINEYPVYNEDNQRVLENPLDDNYQQQKSHNRHRSPSALVTITVDVTLDDNNIHYPEVDTGLNPKPVDEGKDTYSMQMSVVNSLNIQGIEDPQVFDVLDDQIIVTKGASHGIEGTFYFYDVNTMAMEELFSYNLDDFSGDLLPIKHALSAEKSIVPKVDYPRKKYMPLFKLLPNNHLLFVVTTDDGAKIMVVSYTDQGQMSLVKTHDIKQIDDADIYTLLDVKLSPNRQGLLIPYVPESAKNLDKTEVVRPRLAYYTLKNLDGVYDLHYHSTLVNPDESITSVDFIGDESVAVKSVDIRYVTEGTQVWDFWMGDVEKNIHRNCSNEVLTCYYGLYGSTVSIYDIENTNTHAHALLLSASIDDAYHAFQYPNGEPGLEYRHYTTLRQHLFSTLVNKIETVGVTDERRALVRANKSYFQLHYDDRVNTFVYTGASHFPSRKSVKFNPIGQYYCADGVVCSGYLKEAMRPSRNNVNTYTSDIGVHNFKFLDMERDLLAGITLDLTQQPAQSKLSLLSLYNGTAYKGPHVTSDIFDTEVISSGTNNVPGLPFTFQVMDRDTRIDQLSVDVYATTISTTKEADKLGEHIYDANCTVDEEASSNAGVNVGNCSGTVLANFYNADLSQRIDVVVSDGVYTTTKSFTLNVERELPVLSAVTESIPVKDADNYFSLRVRVDSESASTNVLSCTNAGTSYCHLIHNGYVDNWVINNKPTWIAYGNEETSFGHQSLVITGTPSIGDAGTYNLQVEAIQNTSSGEVRTPVTVTVVVQEQDIIADNFSFTAQGDIEKNTLVESNEVTITSINGYTSLSMNSSEGNAEYWRSTTDVWSSADAIDIVNNESIKLRLTSADEYDTSRSIEITVAGVTASFVVSTEADPDAPDSIPDSFSFAAVQDQAISSVAQSAPVTLAGFNQPVALSVSNGEYSLNNSSWTTQAATVESGQSVWVRHTASTEYETQTTTTLTVGGISASFVSTTSAAPAPILSAGGGYIAATVNENFSFTPTNSGGAAASWSITDKPEWAAFNNVTGELSGMVNSTDEFTINITATNASGSDTFTTNVMVNALQAPYINGYSSSCSIDDDQCDYTFTDDSAWRSAITEVTLSNYGSGGDAQVLTSPADYIISEGQLRLLINANNNMAKQSGDWGIVVKALNYDDSQTSIQISAGAVSVGTVDFSPVFEAGKITTVSTQLTNRFGFGEAYQSLNTGLVASNSVSIINEVYRYSGGGSGFVWKEFNADMSQNTLWSDGDGNISFEVKLPGCIDAQDGFTLSLGSTDIIYNNSDGDCVDSEWTNRYRYGVKFSEVDPAGNVYSVFEANGVFDDEYAALGNKDIYVLKQDRNGEKLWLKQVATSQYDLAINIQVDNSGVYLAGSTSGDLDGDGLDEFTSAGGAFILHMDGEGNQTWLKRVTVNDGDAITAMTLAGSKLHYVLHGTSEGNSVIQRDLDGENPVEKVAADAFSGSYAIEYLQLQRDAGGSYYMMTNRRLRDSNDIFSDYHRVHKFDSAGVLVAQSIFLPKESGSANLVVTDSIAYISMTTSVAMTGNGFDNEILNDDGHKAVRVAALRGDDLSIKWTRLVQSTDQYGQDSISAGLELAGTVLYVGASTSGELYYNDALLTTPAATVNLVALHAGDGSELAHKSWITDPNFQPDQYNGLLNLVKGMSIGPNNSLFFTGWIKLNFNQTTYENANGTESYVLKAQLPATAPTLPTEPLGLSRNAYSEIVTDHEHELQWDDTSQANNSTGYWANANSACTNHTDGFGQGGWRLPTDVEVERTGYIPVVGSVFDRVDPFGLDEPDYQVDPDAKYYYWTSTEGGDDSWHAAIEFEGTGDTFPNETSHYYRCVRDMN